MQPAFGYPGGKSRAVKTIIELIGFDSSDYLRVVEPFCGGASFSLSCCNRLWLNDIDHDLYCLWKAIAKHIDDLQDAVRSVKITSDDFYKLQARLLAKRSKRISKAETIKRALDKLVIHKISYSNMGEMAGSPVGGKKQTGKWKFDCRWNPDSICKALRRVHNRVYDAEISCLSFDQVLPCCGKGDFVFVDPPYVEAGSKCYKHSFDMADHAVLADMLRFAKFDWALTYDYHPSIMELYSWASVYDLEFKYFMSSAYRSGGKMKTGKELLICNTKST